MLLAMDIQTYSYVYTYLQKIVLYVASTEKTEQLRMYMHNYEITYICR